MNSERKRVSVEEKELDDQKVEDTNPIEAQSEEAALENMDSEENLEQEAGSESAGETENKKEKRKPFLGKEKKEKTNK